MSFKKGDIVVSVWGTHEGDIGIIVDIATHSGRNKGSALVNFYREHKMYKKTIPKEAACLRHATKEEIAEVSADEL